METFERTEEEIQEIFSHLKSFSEIWVREEFNIELVVGIELNGRLKKALGRFLSHGPQMPISIELQKNLLKFYSYEEIVDVLKHELVHYSLCYLGLPYKDKDSWFISSCLNRNIRLTEQIAPKGYKNIYQCGCKTIETLKKISKKYHCQNCRQKFIFIGQKL